MRADRLLSMLMLLQARGRLTARQLARELEVSERTIYRDIDALSAAGVPVYAEPGRGGGFALLDSYRTTLTGLNEAEVRALFMLSMPAPLADLGVAPELKTALLKLSAALPAARREDEARVRQRFLVDSVAWFQGQTAAPHLQTVQQAVWEDRRLAVTYRLPVGDTVAQRVVDPYGLVAKAGDWYLVYARRGRVRARRVATLLDARVRDDRFQRPANLDLAAFWAQWSASYEADRPTFAVTVRVAPTFLAALPHYFGDGIRAVLAAGAPADDWGWRTLELSFESFEEARDRLLSFGGGVEVLAPEPLRLSIADYARRVVALHSYNGT